MCSTSSKIAVAKVLRRLLLASGARLHQVVTRRGLRFDLDLNEGIDLSIYLFGGFQPGVIRALQNRLPADGVAMDVGANIGAITLSMARHLHGGRVYAFEPTDYAFGKLTRNLDLNPALHQRVGAFQYFVADQASGASELDAYSSWRLDAVAGPDPVHPVHQGRQMAATRRQITLDGFAEEQRLPRLDCLKIDTDGHEFAVLQGAEGVLQRFRPLVVFEACDYLMQPPKPTFAQLVGFLQGLGYRITTLGSHHEITAEDFARRCPEGGGLDLVAAPRGRD